MTLALATFAFSSASAFAAGTVRSIAGPHGGHMLFARTATADPLRALHESDRAFAGYLQTPARIGSVAESRDGHAAYATFRSSLHGAPVAGVMIAAASDGSTQLVALVDRPDRLGRSFGAMLAALQTQPGGAAPDTGASDLRRFTASDNSGSVTLPSNWTVQSASQGQIMARGPQGQAAVLGIGVQVVDPRAGMMANVAMRSGGFVLPYTPDPAAMYVAFQRELARREGVTSNVAFQYRQPIAGHAGAAILGGTEDAKTGREAFLGAFSVGPLNYGGYTLYVQIMTTPAHRLKTDLGTLMAIYRSYSVNGSVRVRQTRASEEAAIGEAQATIDRIHAVGASSMAAARASQAAIDRSTSGYVHYLNGTDIVEHIGSGERGTVDEGFAQGLARDDPQNFRIVPMTQYNAGD